jgi:hypothetical protein
MSRARSYTGGRPPFTRQAHGEFMVSFETKYPAQTHWVHIDHFYNLFLNLHPTNPTGLA